MSQLRQLKQLRKLPKFLNYWSRQKNKIWVQLSKQGS